MKKGKKISGGIYKKSKKKKHYEKKGQETVVKLSEKEKRKAKKLSGGNKKNILLRAKFVNVSSPKKRGVKKLEIKNVLETPSNRFLARQNIVTKGTIVETELGKVKVTNRPSQEEIVNGILIEEFKK